MDFFYPSQSDRKTRKRKRMKRFYFVTIFALYNQFIVGVCLFTQNHGAQDKSQSKPYRRIELLTIHHISFGIKSPKIDQIHSICSGIVSSSNQQSNKEL